MKTFLLLFPLYAWAQTGVNVPLLGTMIDRRGELRSVSGVGGSFVSRPVGVGRALGMACSAAGCVVKTENAVVANGLAVAAPPGKARIAIDDAGALIYFCETGQLARLQDGALAMLEMSVDGQILAVGPGLRFAVKRADGVRVVAADGSILDSLLAETRAVLLLPDAIVYATSDELVIRRADATQLRFSAGGVVDLFAMGEGWVEARARVAIFAIRTAPGREQIYRLPETPQGDRR